MTHTRPRVQINLFGNRIGVSPEGPRAIADAIRVSASLTAADLRINRLNDAAKQMLRESVKDRVGFKLEL